MGRQYEKLKVIRGLLYRVITDNEQQVRQLVLPSIYRNQVLTGLQCDVGHPGRERTTTLIKERFYWPGYTGDVAKFVDNCPRCLRAKANKNNTAPLVNIRSSYPLEIVSTDFLKVDECRGGITNILVITDHFTKYAVAVPTRNQTAKSTAEALLNHFIYPFGIPTKLLSDQGPNFESEIIRELCTLMGIQKIRTTVYHPQCSGVSERFNRSLINMLRTLEPEKKENWKNYIGSLVFSYNVIKHETTGFTPFELMFGRKPRLPVDAMFNLENPETINTDYVRDLQTRMKTAQELSSKMIEKSQEKQKRLYDRKARAVEVKVGDRVLVRILAFTGPHKLADKFEETVYKVKSQPNSDIPVYVVEDTYGNTRVLHRNHLRIIGEEEVAAKEPEDRIIVKPVPRPRRSTVKASTNDVKDKEKVEDETRSRSYDRGEESTDSESETEFIIRRRLTGQQEDTTSEDSHSEEPEVSIPEEPEVQEATPQEPEQSRPQVPRRSIRERRKPAKFEDYLIGQQQVTGNLLLKMQQKSNKMMFEMLKAYKD